MYKVAQASFEISDRMLEDIDLPADIVYIKCEIAKSLAAHIAKDAGFTITRNRGSQDCYTRFTSQAIVFLDKKDLDKYVKQQAKKMIDNGSVA